jgi:PPOX class probable F420-dependent enzyme
MTAMDDAIRDAFLTERRYGILTTLNQDGSPVSVPIWYEWDGSVLRMFSWAKAGKIKRLESDPRATVIVANHPDEAEGWVSFHGRIEIKEEGGLALAERVFDRYYPEGDSRRGALDRWRKVKDEWRLLELRPETIRSHVE